MPSDSKRTEKSKRKRSRKSTVDKAENKKRTKKTQKAKKTKKRKRLTQEEINERAKAAFAEVEAGKVDVEEMQTTTAIVPAQLLTREELDQFTRENSFLLNPVLANASLQKDLQLAAMRAHDLQNLHEYLHDPVNQANFDEKTLVTLYGIGIQDFHKTMTAKLKIAEMSDKARILRDASKYYVEQEKQREIAAEDTSHTSEIIRALLDESMRHALDDELNKKWQGSNSYRPPEESDYEILAIDENADD